MVPIMKLLRRLFDNVVTRGSADNNQRDKKAEGFFLLQRYGAQDFVPFNDNDVNDSVRGMYTVNHFLYGLK